MVLTGSQEDGLEFTRWIDPPEFWKLTTPPAPVEAGEGEIVLERSALGDPLPPPPQEGSIRTFGMFGQVDLMRRRTRAIRNLEKHSYLLRALSAPGEVWMDTGPTSLPVPLDPDRDRVDTRKQEVMKDILRVRPLYALQGPPGTGKTTLVSHLVRQILTEDPVAQILITAQAHPAVDLLRAKVRDDAFRDIEQPLAVRLGADDISGEISEGSVKEVTLRVLETSRDKLRARRLLSPLQEQWLNVADNMIAQIATRTTLEPGTRNFLRLVGSGASLTYCTTTAGDLEELAAEARSFDWSIVEEAGKVHGFDMALPLQAGHRWLLIGDPKQLPPYREEDYQKIIENLDDAVEWLKSLPAQSARLLDRGWLNSWAGRSSAERQDFRKYVEQWLWTFDCILSSCRFAVDGTDRRTIDASNGSMAGLLSLQYRMHPTIGDLISTTYYDNELVNATVDASGRPRPYVVHPFILPAGIAGKAIVWIDLPWAERDSSCEEQGEGRTIGGPRYRNEREVDALEIFLKKSP